MINRSQPRPPTAPPGFRATGIGYTLLLVPAALGAWLDWPWWMPLLLFAPGYLFLHRAGAIAARRRGIRTHIEPPTALLCGVAAVLGGIYGLAVDVVPERDLGLCVVGVAVGLDAVQRLWWRRYDRARGASSTRY